MIEQFVDKRIEQLGYKKTIDDNFGAEYKKIEPQNYTHTVYIGRKASGNHILQSYDHDSGDIGVGMTFKELVLFTLKFWLKKRKWR